MITVDRGYLGRHFIAEFYKCSQVKINDPESVERIMTEAARISGATIIKPFFHSFSPQGVSGIIVISESHFAIHTWPEHSYAAVDLFSCSDFKYRDALKYIKDNFESDEYLVNVINRGLHAQASTSSYKIPAERITL